MKHSRNQLLHLQQSLRTDFKCRKWQKLRWKTMKVLVPQDPCFSKINYHSRQILIIAKSEINLLVGLSKLWKGRTTSIYIKNIEIHDTWTQIHITPILVGVYFSTSWGLQKTHLQRQPPQVSGCLRSRWARLACAKSGAFDGQWSLIGGFNPSKKYWSVGITIPKIWKVKKHLNMKVSWDDGIPNGKNRKCSEPEPDHDIWDKTT